MGVHGNAEKIVREYGFVPHSSHSTLKKGGPGGLAQANTKSDEVVSMLDEFLSTEGIVRIYALLQSALQTSSPKFDIGTGGKALVKALQKRLEPSKEDREMLMQIETMQEQLDDLQKRVKERSPQSMSRG